MSTNIDKYFSDRNGAIPKQLLVKYQNISWLDLATSDIKRLVIPNDNEYIELMTLKTEHAD